MVYQIWTRYQPATLLFEGEASSLGVLVSRAVSEGVDLSGAGLENVDLVEASLVNASLQNAQLTNTSLAGAKLNGANLSGAVCYGTDFRGAILDNAIFSVSTDLFAASLRRASWTGSNILAANIQDAVLDDFPSVIQQLLDGYSGSFRAYKVVQADGKSAWREKTYENPKYETGYSGSTYRRGRDDRVYEVGQTYTEYSSQPDSNVPHEELIEGTNLGVYLHPLASAIWIRLAKIPAQRILIAEFLPSDVAYIDQRGSMRVRECTFVGELSPAEIAQRNFMKDRFSRHHLDK